MIALTQEKREELKAFLSASIEKRCTVYTLAKQRELEALRDQIALASITAQPFGYVEEDAVKDRERLFSAQVFADEEDLPGYEFSELSCPLYLYPPVPAVKFPEKLPCDVSVSPNVVFRKGVNTQVLLNCLIRKSDDSNGLGD